MTVRTCVLRPYHFNHAETRRHVIEFLGHGVADARLQRPAGAPLIGVRHVDLDTIARQLRREGAPTGRSCRPATLTASPLAGVHFGRLLARLQLLGQLREGQTKLVGTDPFRFLAEEFLAQGIELLAERGVFARQSRQLRFERRYTALRLRQIGDVVHVARMIRES